MIQDAAAKCRFCGEWLDPSKRPDWAPSAELQPAAAPAPKASVAPEAAAAPAVNPAPVAREAKGDPGTTTTDGSVHRPRRRETQTWSAPAWMAPGDRDERERRAQREQPESPSPQRPRAAAQPTPDVQRPVPQPVPPQPMAQPMAEPMAQPMAEPMAEPMAGPMVQPVAQPPTEPPIEHSIDEVAERMRRIKASAAAVREAMLAEAASLQPDVLPARDAAAANVSNLRGAAPGGHLGPLDDDPLEAAETMHSGSSPAAAAPPSDAVAARLGDDFADDDDDDFADEQDDRRDDALPTSAKGALDGFDFGDDFDDEGDDDFDGDFGDVGARRPVPWKPVAIVAAVVLVVGVGVFWDRIFPSETLQEAPSADGADAQDPAADPDAKAADGQVAQGSIAPAPGQGQPVVPEGSQPAAVGAPPADPNAAAAAAAAGADPNAPVAEGVAVPVDPNAAVADPNAPVPAAPAVPATPLPADAAATLDEARGLYQKGGKRRLGEAKDSLQGILAASPNNADALLLMAQVQLELGETEDSLKTATQCTTVAPQTADCWLTIGALKQNEKDKDAAASAYERYLALAPEGAYASQVRKQLKRLD